MTLVPLHPEATDDPSRLRWVVPPGVLHLVGRPAEVPGALARLLEDGTVVDIVVGADAVDVTLGPGCGWRADGPRVRDALTAALAEADAWRAADPDAEGPDAVLRDAVGRVIAGDVGEYVRSHGGRITLLDAADGRARIALDGECSSCPARSLTLHLRFERALRALYPGLTRLDVRDEGRPGRRRGGAGETVGAA